MSPSIAYALHGHPCLPASPCSSVRGHRTFAFVMEFSYSRTECCLPVCRWTPPPPQGWCLSELAWVLRFVLAEE